MIMSINPQRREMQTIANILITELKKRGLLDSDRLSQLQAMQPGDAIEAFFEIARCPAVRFNDGDGFIEIRPASICLVGLYTR